MCAEPAGNALSIAKTDKSVVIAAHLIQPGEKPQEGLAQKMSTAARAIRDYLKSVGY